MWTELLKTDNFDSFIATQKCCADHYKDFDQSTIGWCFEYREKFRMFHYCDDDYEINLATNMESPEAIRVSIVGVNKCLDLTIAINKIIDKINEIVSEYGVNRVVATWQDNNLDLVNSFYFGLANTLVNQSFTGSIKNPREHVYTADVIRYSN